MSTTQARPSAGTWRRTAALIIALGLGLSTLAACSKGQSGAAAPSGDRAVLEKLADAYRSVAEQLPVSPASQPPKGKRQFVEAVFMTAGYDYSATLSSLAASLDPSNTLHRDMVELVFFPLNNLPNEEIAKLYSEEEVAAITQIKGKM